ncbi:MAG TPA: carboxypeptidase regulatory-like domain-containing protein, partial [Longimicrobium sp.]
LGAGERSIRLVGFAVPRDARAGSYFVKLGLRGLPARDSVRVVVAGRRALALRVDGAPRFAVAGEPYTLRFVLENRGNSAERVALRISGSPGATLPAAEVELAAGETRAIPVQVSTKRGATLRHDVEVRARSQADSAVRAVARAGVDVVTRGGSAAERGRLPVEVRVRSAGLPALSGSGSLARGGSSRVDFLLRPVDAPGALRAQQDECRLRVARPGMELLLGDQVYALSPLTQPGRSGFGAGGSVAAGPVSAGGYVARDRRSPDAAEERGGHVALALGRAASVAAHYLGFGDGSATSARARFTPSRLLTVDAEAGRGHGPRGSGSAESLVVQGSSARTSWFARHLRADSAYPATFAGERVDEASVSVRPAGKLLVSGTAVHQRGTASRDLLLGTVGYGSLAAEYRDVRGQDWSAQSVALRGRYRAGALWISPRAEVGTREDSAASAPFHRVSAYGGIDVGRQSLSASVEHSSGRAAGPLREDDAFQAALRAAIYPAPGTRVDAVLLGSRAGAGEWRNASAEAGVSQQLPRGHRLLARARWILAGAGSAGSPGVLLDYVIPIGVPVARGGEGGRVSGRVFDAESGRGVAGVPVRLGTQVALTDHAGTWRFANVRPGAHPLEVDRLGAGLERVPVRPVPASVEVRDGRSVRVDVGLVRSARVWGAVRVFDFAEPSAAGSARPPTVESGGLRDALLVLSAGDEAHRRSTDSGGRFEMADLRPGRWTLRVEHADLPPHHRLEHDSLVLELAGGSTQEVLLRVLPRFRPVRIIAGGEVRASDAATPERPAPAAAPRVAALPLPALAPPRPAPAVPAPGAEPPAPAAATPRPTRAVTARPAPLAA